MGRRRWIAVLVGFFVFLALCGEALAQDGSAEAKARLEEAVCRFWEQSKENELAYFFGSGEKELLGAAAPVEEALRLEVSIETEGETLEASLYIGDGTIQVQFPGIAKGVLALPYREAFLSLAAGTWLSGDEDIGNAAESLAEAVTVESISSRRIAFNGEEAACEGYEIGFADESVAEAVCAQLGLSGFSLRAYLYGTQLVMLCGEWESRETGECASLTVKSDGGAYPLQNYTVTITKEGANGAKYSGVWQREGAYSESGAEISYVWSEETKVNGQERESYTAVFLEYTAQTGELCVICVGDDGDETTDDTRRDLLLSGKVAAVREDGGLEGPQLNLFTASAKDMVRFFSGGNLYPLFFSGMAGSGF